MRYVSTILPVTIIGLMIALLGCIGKTSVNPNDYGPASFCGTCPAEKPVCDENAKVCVGCLSNSDCKDATKAVCDQGERACVPCTSDDQCGHIANTGMCNAGTCVQCTPETEAEKCPAPEAGKHFSCNPKTFGCTTTLTGSLNACTLCVADSECPDGYGCVIMNYKRTQRPGAYCLQVDAGDCADPFSAAISDRGSLTKPEEKKSYCGIVEDTTTCEAVRGLLDNKGCPNGTDNECGAGIGDALCRKVGSVNNRCTYACETLSECPGSKPCGTTAPKLYCGAS